MAPLHTNPPYVALPASLLAIWQEVDRRSRRIAQERSNRRRFAAYGSMAAVRICGSCPV